MHCSENKAYIFIARPHSALGLEFLEGKGKHVLQTKFMYETKI